MNMLLLLALLLCGTFTVYGAEVETTLCAYDMSGKGSLTHPGSSKSNIIPKKFSPLPSAEFCLGYGTLRWKQDLVIRMINSTTEDVQIYATKGHALTIPTITGMSMPSELELGPITASTVAETYILSSTTTLRGNETAQFTIVFPRNSSVSIAYRRKRQRRKLLCSSLDTQFDVISCTKGARKKSKCTFKCKENYGPSPLFYQSGISEDFPEIEKLGKDLPNFTSVCRSTKDGRPIWSPNAVEWMVHSHYGSGISLHSTCMSYEDLAIACIEVKRPAYYNPCQNYPQNLLLEIFDQKSDVEPAIPPTTPPPPLVTSNLDETGWKKLNARERQFILNELQLMWRESCLEMLTESIQNINGTNANSTRVVIREELTQEVLKNLRKAFGETCSRSVLCQSPIPCAKYCKWDETANGYAPGCGTFPSTDHRACMDCRRNSCTSDSIMIC